MRSTHRLSLTPEGELLYQRFQEIVRLYDEAMRDIRKSAKGIRGELRIGYYYIGGPDFLGKSLTELRRRYEYADLVCMPMQMHQMNRVLQEGGCDVALTMLDSSMTSEDYSFLFAHSCRLKCFIGKRHPLAGREKISLSELEKVPVLLCRHEKTYNEFLMNLFAENGNTFKNIVYCEQIDLMPSMLADKNAFYIGAEEMEYGLKPYEVTSISFEEEDLRAPVYFVSRRDNENPCVPLYIGL